MLKTYIPKISQVEKRWHLVDAEGQILGRLATKVANLLRGKEKEIYSPHLDTGDFVIVVNAEKVKLSGRKEDQKVYRHYSGYPGGLKEVPLTRLRERHPERIIQHAVAGMIPKNKLGRAMLKKLKVYTGPNHPHEDQKPTAVQL